VEYIDIGDSDFPTLQSLDFSWHDEPSGPGILHVLPLSLQRLSIASPYCRSLDDDDEDWNTLSRFTSLKTLDFSPHPRSFSFAQALMIPRSVTDLTFSHFTMPSEQWLAEVMGALPPDLKALRGIWPRKINRSVAQMIPRTIELIDARVGAKAVSDLPDSLTELKLSPGNYPAISSFPSKLKELQSMGDVSSLFDKLPVNLRDWTVGRSPNTTINAQIASMLPRNLTWLDLGFGFKPIDEIESMFKALPPSLTHFRGFPFSSDILPTTPIPTPPESSVHLPRFMKTLETGCFDFAESSMPQWILGLPDSLTTLQIQINHFQQGALTSFGILNCLKTLEICVLNSPVGGWAQHLDCRSLPPTLLHLRIIDPNISDYEASETTKNAFVGAPKWLKSSINPW
jgi:hypothetical protein